MKQKYNEQSEHDPCHRLTSSSQNDRMIFFVLRGLYYGEPWWGRLCGWKCCFLVLRGWGWGGGMPSSMMINSPLNFSCPPFRHVPTTINCSLSLFDFAPPPPPYTFIPLFISEKLIWPQKLLEVSSDSPPVFQGGWCLGGHPRFRSLHPSQRKSACS